MSVIHSTSPLDHSPTVFDRLARRIRPGTRILNVMVRYAPNAQKRFWGVCYNYITRVSASDVTVLNYGYASLDQGDPPLNLADEPEGDRYCLQLYQRVAGAVELQGKDVLEIGCGRGGGAAFVKRVLGPRSLTGIDYAERAVAFCNRQHQLEGLSFARGDAENVPAPDHSFDAVLNVESSHCYPSMSRFLGEVVRVLKDGGHFLFADLRPRGQGELLRRDLLDAGLEIVEEEWITPNVQRALELSSQHRRKLVRTRVPRVLRPFAGNIAGVEGYPIFEAFRAGQVDYVRFVARKGTTRSTTNAL